MKALLSRYRQSPRKVRLVANLVKGKKVAEAMTMLSFLPKRAATPVKKLIQSAVANATSAKASVKAERLFIKDITVNKSLVLRRFRAGGRGRGYPLKKRASRLEVHLIEK